MEPAPAAVGEDMDCHPQFSPLDITQPPAPRTEPLLSSQPDSSIGSGDGVGGEALSSASDAARTTWERTNLISDASDEHLKYDVEVHQSIVNAKPWEKDPHYFKFVKVSAIALLKMLIHAHSGDTCEVMGLLIGKVAHETMIVVDVAPLPVNGTETRVNAQSEAYEYIVAYKDLIPQVGRTENVLGWYHSHPGYGCWLSGIDVATQHLNQTYQEPFVAIVVDPTRTISCGKVNLDAFRTYPEGYKPSDEGPSEYQSIPMEKIEDFGVHCKRYYSLEVSYFKSSLEKQIFSVLWNKYWVNALCSTNTMAQSNHITSMTKDLAEKVDNAVTTVSRLGSDQAKLQEKLAKCSKDASKMVLEQMSSLVGQIIKDSLFQTS